MVEINKIVRSKRKTLALVIEPDGTLTVRAPLQMDKATIDQFVQAKRTWIQRKQAQVGENSRRPRSYVEGETFPFLGQDIPLRLVSDQEPALVMDREFRLSRSQQLHAERIFLNWYRKKARVIIQERVSEIAPRIGFEPGRVRISSARTRWGSCSTKGTLSFTWRLVMAPLDVIDYVIVHELCHLKVMSHSKTFWTLVGEILPGYKLYRNWLKVNGHKLKL